jgi:hypothetical protein
MYVPPERHAGSMPNAAASEKASHKSNSSSAAMVQQWDLPAHARVGSVSRNPSRKGAKKMIRVATIVLKNVRLTKIADSRLSPAGCLGSIKRMNGLAVHSAGDRRGNAKRLA